MKTQINTVKLQPNLMMKNYARCLLETLLEEEDNVKASEIIERFGLDTHHIESEDNIPRRATIFKAMHYAQKHLGLKGIAIIVASKRQLADLGAFGYALHSCATFGDVQDVASKLYRSLGTEAHSVTEHTEDSLIVTLYEDHKAFAFREVFLEEWAIAVWKFSRDLCPSLNSTHLKEIHFSFPKPSHHELLQDYFGCPIQYQSTTTKVIFDANTISEPIPSANEVMAQTCQQICENLIFAEASTDPTVNRLRSLIMQNEDQFRLKESKAASLLGISERTLRRRLKAQNLNYRQIVNEIRIHIAANFLINSELMIKQIAYTLGFDHASGFLRVFREYTGMTPGLYQQKAREFSTDQTSLD